MDSSDSEASSEWDVKSSISSDATSSIKPLTVPLRFFQRIDSLLRVAGDSADERLVKTATMFCMFLFAVPQIPFIIVLAFIESPRLVGVTSACSVFAWIGCFVLIRFKHRRGLARTVAHLFVLMLQTALFIGSAPLGVFFSDGQGDAWGPIAILYPTATAVAAFIFRDSKWIFFHTGLSIGLLYFTVGYWWGTPGLSTQGVISATAYIVANLLVEALILSYFGAISDSLTISAALANAGMRDAVHAAEAERKANAAKTRFVSIMSHEIRNPLQAVVLQLEMLHETSMSGEQYSLVQGISRSSGMLLEIVNDVLDITKIEAGAVTLEEIPFDVRTIAEAVIEAYAPKATQKGISVFLTLDPSLATGVCGDPTRLRQVLANYVGNAIKFTKQGEVELSITMDAAAPDGRGGTGEDAASSTTGDPADSSTSSSTGFMVKLRKRRARDSNRPTEGTYSLAAPLWTFAVRDTGQGIDEEGQRKLFREFAQVDESTTREFGGTGLGLFICKQLSELMGGGVAIQSTLGVGSTFIAQARLLPEPTGYADHLANIVMPPSSTKIPAVAVASNCGKFADSLATTVGAVLGRAYGEACSPEAIYSVKALASQMGDYGASTLLLVDGDDMSRKDERIFLTKDPSRMVLLQGELSPSARRDLVDKGWVHVLGKPATLVDLARVVATAVGGSLTRSGSATVRSGKMRSSGASARARKKRAAQGTERGQGGDADPSQVLLAQGGASKGVRTLSGVSGEDPIAASSRSREPDDVVDTRPFVLVVDDFQLVRDLVCRVVESLGYPVRFAPNGKVALDTVTEQYDSIGMIVMDCEMPVMDGFVATQRIREYEASIGIGSTGRVPICSMTANAMREDVQKCLNIGMDDFLSKPVRKQALQAKLETLYRSRGPSDARLRLGSLADPGDDRASSKTPAPDIAPP